MDLFSFFFSVMDGSLPKSLKHIISNAEYYGASLFLLGQLFYFGFYNIVMSYVVLCLSNTNHNVATFWKPFKLKSYIIICYISVSIMEHFYNDYKWYMLITNVDNYLLTMAMQWISFYSLKKALMDYTD